MASINVADSDKIIPDAYHGTSLGNAQLIDSERRFRPSRGEDNYLGDGVYFFESSRRHAYLWASKHNVSPPGPIAVICAQIRLGRCLDLHNLEHRNYLKTVANLFRERGVKKINDAIVINFLAGKVPIDTVRAPHVQPGIGKIFDESRFFDYFSLMICVRNHECIQDFDII